MSISAMDDDKEGTMSRSLQVWAADKEVKHTDCKMDQRASKATC